MKIGTKSLLFGAHQFILHPIALAIAWTKLYGFPRDPRLWAAFVVHDWGYWGKGDMDGPEGGSHPELGAAIMRRLFGQVWADFTLYHSRRYAREKGSSFSQLCVADKLATHIMPAWLYVPLVRATGEIHEYMKPDAGFESDEYMKLIAGVTCPYVWFARLKVYMAGVIERTKDQAVSVSALESRAE